MRQQNEKTGVHSAIAHETSTKYIYIYIKNGVY